MNTSHPIICPQGLPVELRDIVEAHWSNYLDTAIESGISPPSHPDFLNALCRVWAGSDFVADSCIQHPDLLDSLLERGDLNRDYQPDEFVYHLHDRLKAVDNDDDLMRVLRQLRRYEMVRIAWRNLAGWAGLDETLRDISGLADACVDAALYKLHHFLCREHGVPATKAERSQHMIVLGMGKLGGHELNFSSDIDLIFAYAKGIAGEALAQFHGGITNDEYFNQLGQRLVHALDARTEDGFVFRVDMRLRPFGSSGALVASVDAMEDYYQTHGRDWERYALAKARVIAGDLPAGQDLLARLRPFVYRRYLDFGAFDALRQMKVLINKEVKRKQLGNNIKLGAGGIREIEFIGQTFQMIRGGREPDLQTTSTRQLLNRLTSAGHLPAYVRDELLEAYQFLRNTEHRLQYLADEQTHDLPDEPTHQCQLAYAMGFDDWSAFASQLERHRQQVQSHFAQVFESPQTDVHENDNVLVSVWQGSVDEAEAQQILADSGYDDAAEAVRRLLTLKESHSYRSQLTGGRVWMEQLMPLVLAAVAATQNPSRTLGRILDLLETVARRSAYLALLVENPMALSQLVKLCEASPWIAEYLNSYPALLDELLDPRNLYQPLDKGELEQALDRLLGHVSAEDLEQQMEALRRFKQVNILRVAAADVTASTPLMVVSDHLTWIAEVVLARVLRIAWQHMSSRHGSPECRIGNKPCDSGFSMVAYGKLGGIELGYGSDLDLVFIHAGDEDARTHGHSPLEAGVWFARLAQRIIHILNTPTPSGVLYEVDTRLRPSGASGLLVSSLSAFQDYQLKEAWTWEHQALVRARVVAGDPLLEQAFNKLRQKVLTRDRDPVVLRQEIRDMRARMRQELASHQSGIFDLKQGLGGIADIEFMVQYGVLLGASKHPQLLGWTDNIRLLETLANTGYLSNDDADLLSDAYRTYRAAAHRMTLQEEPAHVDEDMYQDERVAVSRIWHKLMEQDEPKHIRRI